MINKILQFLFGKKKNMVSVKKPKIYITANDIITASGRYPERANSGELTAEVRSNIQDLASRVNLLLSEIDWKDPIVISSGFRPSAVNANVKGAATKSAHTLGMALDIVQPKNNNLLGQKIREVQNKQGKSGILGKHGLMMECIEVTVGKNTSWVHLDTRSRTVRPTMEFKP